MSEVYETVKVKIPKASMDIIDKLEHLGITRSDKALTLIQIALDKNGWNEKTK